MRLASAWAIAACLLVAGPAQAITIVQSNFDQVEQLDTLGGTVIQIGGGGNGNRIRTAAQFSGVPGDATGVSVSLPSWVAAGAFESLNDGGSNKPGNDGGQLLGDPTDLTFTVVGPGGPDAGPGDGSVEFQGGRVDVTFGGLITAPLDSDPDLYILTGAPGGAEVRVTLLGPNGNVLNPRATVTLSGGFEGSGLGGILLDVPNGVTYSGVRLDRIRQGTIDVDAVYGRITTLPEPSTAVMLGFGLALLALVRRRSYD